MPKKPEEWLEAVSPPQKTRGVFKLFLGYAPGVGKTFSMLSEALRRRSRGEDVVIGVVETHGRQGIEELAQQLEQILDHDVRFDVASLSRNPGADRTEHVDSFTVNGRTLQLQLERVTLRSGLSVWLFASASVALIPQLARLASDSPVEISPGCSSLRTSTNASSDLSIARGSSCAP